MAEEEVTSSGSDETDFSQYHEVQQGDTLWKIAERYYGDGSLYTNIFEANRDVLDDADKIKIGQKLRIP